MIPMHRWLPMVALAAALSCNRAPLSARDAAASDVAANSALVVGQIVVMKEGSGRGTVISSPGGITCGGTCAADFVGQTVVTLSAEPDSTSDFEGWSGPCQGTGPCTLSVNATHAVTASFVARERTLSVSVTGRGRVTSYPTKIDCGQTCTVSFESGLGVVLTATAEGDSRFVGWSGACTGATPCSITLDADRMVTAHFEPVKEGLSVAKNGSGAGRVTSSPLGIDCGDACAASFVPGTNIILQASPDDTSTFTGWSGLCEGTEACVLRMSSAGSVTAGFERIQYGLSIDKIGSGSGSVRATPAGIASTNSCAANYAVGTLVTLTATPDETSIFTGWTGACAGAGACTIAMEGAQTVSATFEAIRRRLSISRTGRGDVTSIPSGLRCGDFCSADFVIGTHVLLQVTPEPGSTFVGWSGACSGSAPCTVIMDEDRSLAAAFR
jgi:hypothetical protein